MPASTHATTQHANHIPEPVRHLERELRSGLITHPGRRCLETVFGPPEAIQLELAVDGLIAPLTRLRTDDELHRRRLRRAASQATFTLRRATDTLGATPAPLSPAEAAVTAAAAQAEAMGPVGINIATVLRHLELHIRIARLWEGETAPADLFNALNRAPEQIKASLADWHAWSDARIGPLECIDPLSDGRCRQLGYRFREQVHAVYYAGERRTHQGLLWQALRADELAIARAGLTTWNKLRRILHDTS